MSTESPEKSSPKEPPRAKAVPHHGAPGDSPEPWGWTARQRVGLGVLLAILLAFLIVQWIRRPQRLDYPAAPGPDASILPQYMDPNTASAAELARIPHMGDATAAKIVAFREERKGATGDGIVFRQLSDLAKIKGIGPQLSAQFEPYLKFPESNAPAATSTRP